jgi:hypothetical protein
VKPVVPLAMATAGGFELSLHLAIAGTGGERHRPDDAEPHKTWFQTEKPLLVLIYWPPPAVLRSSLKSHSRASPTSVNRRGS